MTDNCWYSMWFQRKICQFHKSRDALTSLFSALNQQKGSKNLYQRMVITTKGMFTDHPLYLRNALKHVGNINSTRFFATIQTACFSTGLFLVWTLANDVRNVRMAFKHTDNKQWRRKTTPYSIMLRLKVVTMWALYTIPNDYNHL